MAAAGRTTPDLLSTLATADDDEKEEDEEEEGPWITVSRGATCFELEVEEEEMEEVEEEAEGDSTKMRISLQSVDWKVRREEGWPSR